MFWYGILPALGRTDPPGRMAGLLFVIALLATGLLHPAGGHAHSVGVPYVIVAVIAVLAGLYFGRNAGSGSWGIRLPSAPRNAGGNQPLGCGPGHLSARRKER